MILHRLVRRYRLGIRGAVVRGEAAGMWRRSLPDRCDTETGEDYFNARYFGSVILRFLSPDRGCGCRFVEPADLEWVWVCWRKSAKRDGSEWYGKCYYSWAVPIQPGLCKSDNFSLWEYQQYLNSGAVNVPYDEFSLMHVPVGSLQSSLSSNLSQQSATMSFSGDANVVTVDFDVSLSIYFDAANSLLAAEWQITRQRRGLSRRRQTDRVA